MGWLLSPNWIARNSTCWRTRLWQLFLAVLLLWVSAFASGPRGLRNEELIWLLVISLFVAACSWWASHAGSNKAFVLRVISSFGLLLSLIAILGAWLIADEKEDKDLAEMVVWFYGGATALVIFSVCLLITFPFFLARLATFILRIAEQYYAFCILNNKLPTMLILFVFGAIATGYPLFYK